MSENAQAAEDFIGPIDYLILEFPEAHFTGEGLPILLDLVDRGIVRILDLAVVKVDDDGHALALTLQQVVDEYGATEWEVFLGASSGLLDATDFEAAAAISTPGSAVAILVYENTWAAPFAAAMRRAGGQMVSFGRIPVADLLAAIETDAETAAVEA